MMDGSNTFIFLEIHLKDLEPDSEARTQSGSLSGGGDVRAPQAAQSACMEMVSCSTTNGIKKPVPKQLDVPLETEADDMFKSL